MSVPTSVGVAAAFQLCFTAQHFYDRRRSGSIVTPALVLTYLLLTLGNFTPKGIKNNNNMKICNVHNVCTQLNLRHRYCYPGHFLLMVWQLTDKDVSSLVLHTR